MTAFDATVAEIVAICFSRASCIDAMMPRVLVSITSVTTGGPAEDADAEARGAGLGVLASGDGCAAGERATRAGVGGDLRSMVAAAAFGTTCAFFSDEAVVAGRATGADGISGSSVTA